MEPRFPAIRVSLIALSFFAWGTLTAPAYSAQATGFGVDHWIDGPRQDVGFGQVSGVGDVNNDGYDEFMIGAPNAAPGGVQNAGSVFIYSGFSRRIIHQIDGTEVNQFLGRTLSRAGDVNADGLDDIVIGSPYSTVGGKANAGTATIYSGLDGSVLYRFKGSAINQHFGRSVSQAGDINADGYADIIVGTLTHNAYIYSGATGNLIYSPTPPYAWINAHTVTGGGDLNGDGFDDFAISHPLQSGTGAPDGIVFAYSGADGSLLYEFAAPGSNINFGGAICFAGDVNADGNADLLVAAPGDPNVWGAGSIRVYSGLDGSVLHNIDGTHANQAFGDSISRAGDWNKDGYDDFLVGSGRVLSSLNGKVELFSGATGSKLYMLEPADDSNIGNSISYIGDMNGNGHPNCIAGAPGRNERPYFGSAAILGLGPILTLSSNTVSIILGGTIEMEMEFPPMASRMNYKILLSAHGTGPTKYGVSIPLTFDTMALKSAYGIYPFPNHSNMHGKLSISGQASASMVVPPNLPTEFLGRTFWLAAVAHPNGLKPKFTSIAQPMLLNLF